MMHHQSEDGERPGGSLKSTRRTVLYVDDSPENLRLVMTILRQRPQFRLLTAASPTEGLDLAARERPDLVLLDLMMPVMDGFEVLRQLRAAARTRDIPVFAISAHVHPDEIRRARESGFERFFTKPFDVQALLAAMDEAIDAKVPAKRSLVLCIEDNPPNLRLIERILADMDDIELVSAHSASLGLDLARARAPDAILMDINLPGMDGYEALRRLRAEPRLSGIPVIAVTALAMPSDIARGRAAGFAAYLTKPLDIPAFRQALRAALLRVQPLDRLSDTNVSKLGDTGLPL